MPGRTPARGRGCPLREVRVNPEGGAAVERRGQRLIEDSVAAERHFWSPNGFSDTQARRPAVLRRILEEIAPRRNAEGALSRSSKLRSPATRSFSSSASSRIYEVQVEDQCCPRRAVVLREERGVVLPHLAERIGAGQVPVNRSTRAGSELLEVTEGEGAAVPRVRVPVKR